MVFTAALAALGGCRGGSDDGAEATRTAAESSDASSACAGTLEGIASGPFTCVAVANFYPGGSSMVAGRTNAIVSILSNPYDPTHTRPAGVASLGINVEIAGEPAAGTFDSNSGVVAASGAMTLEGGESCDRVGALRLEISSVRFLSEETIEGIGVNRSYALAGAVQFTLTGGDGREVRVKATF